MKAASPLIRVIAFRIKSATLSQLQRRILFFCLGLLCWLSLRGDVALAQNYLTASGQPTFAAPEPVDLGFLNTANGNLHLEIPMGSFPQRASQQPLKVYFAYDSNAVWRISCTLGCGWEPDGPEAGYVSGWRLASSQASAYITTAGIACQGVTLDGNGTTRNYWLSGTDGYGNTCTGDGYASDSSGYQYLLINFKDLIYAPDGTNAGDLGAVDPNGNQINGKFSEFDIVDTLGRTIVTNSKCIDACQYGVTNSQGGTSAYTTATASINVKTNFGQSGVTDWSGSITVISSVMLPDGTAYTFKYDCDSTVAAQAQACSSPGGQTAYYGLLTNVTLPTQGTISYTYTLFNDSYSNKVRWLSSRTSASGTWNYVPQVLTTCSSTSVGCQQKVTVTKPNGDSNVYTFTLNNGAWPVQVQSFDGSGNLLSTINNTYDFSQACPFSSCHGAAYIRLLSTQTALPIPGGTLTKQTTYAYDSPHKGNVTAQKEWRYYSGTSPTFPSIPDRATYKTYLTTGTNDINRPLSVTLCNNSGSDSACPGGGSRVSQTLYTYDSYSSTCPSGGLASVTGTSNHDDTNFGPGYLQRGNLTQIQRWTSSSSYQTTQLCYDTTGQVTQQADPKGNVTTFAYADKFYSDNGTSSLPSYTPSKPTNAYLTSITQPLIGTTSIAYYYGSGSQAFTTDPNGVASYSHFMDQFDRVTENDYSLAGWDKTVYSSSTQGDIYLGVGDTTPSPSCSSCQHKQIMLDGWGRKISEKLMNGSGATVSEVDTSYDSNGRVMRESHLYSGTSDPNYVFETYTYDGLDRKKSATHPDNSSLQTAYGVKVAALSGLTTQQSASATYGYGYPVVSMDESRNQRQQWLDGFGNTIEVDEPSAASGTPGTGTITIGGNEREISGTAFGCTGFAWDGGTISITVNGVAVAYVSFGDSSTANCVTPYPMPTPYTIASQLVSAINGNSSFPVTATLSGSTVTLTSNSLGSSSNYSLSVSLVDYFAQEGYPPPSFFATTSGSTLTGGSGGPGISSSPLFTAYSYDAIGNLTRVSQGVQSRSFVYDGLSRPVSVTTPEAGTETMSYTISGALCSGEPENVCQRTDARGVVTTYYYDALNRLVGKSYTIPSGSIVAPMPNVCTTSTGISANVCYSYDQGGALAFALGRPTQMIDPSGSETYTYDAAGRITKVSKVIGSLTYPIQYKYNVADEVTQVTYPSNRIVQQSYNSIGWICEIAPTTSTCGSSASPFSTGYNYDAAGHLLNFNSGNGVTTNYSYSANRTQLANLNFTRGSQTLFSLAYWYQKDSTNCPNGSTFGNNGQIQCITDAVDGGRTANYTYDPLGRLNSAVTNGSTNFPKWGLSESYDRYGNRVAQTVTAGSGYQSSLSFANPGGAQTNHPDGWCFDASGNLLSKTATTCPPGAPAFVYDGENRMVSDSGVTFVYDGNGTRVQKCVPNCTNPTSSTVFIFSDSQDIAEYDNFAASGSPSREFIYSDMVPGPGLLATITGGASPKTTYFHADHLSWRLSTDGTSGSSTYGQVNGQQGTGPFGESLYSTNGNEFVFTTYQRDSETGLDYAMARYYDSGAARFCTADPLGGRLEDPQTWNRYAYVRNDPVNLRDPSGKGFLTWLFDALAILGDILSGGATTPELVGQLGFGSELSTLAAVARTGVETQPQGRPTPPPLPPAIPQAPPGYKPCAPVKFLITGVGPHQAKGPGATGTPPTNGDVAFNPKNYGLTNSQGRRLADSDKPLIFQPDWSKAQIPGPNGRGTVQPAPDRGLPQTPDGLPVGTDDTLPGTDVIGGINRGANQNRIDIYRYPTQDEAQRSTRRVPVVVFIPNGSKAKCPK